MDFKIDMILVAAGLFALACVMILLANRPGRRRRADVTTLLSWPSDTPSDGADWQVPPGLVLPKHCVFISYRRKDSGEIVERLYDHLSSSLGGEAVFKDVDSLHLGQDFRTQLETSLNACLVFLCVIGDRWAGTSNAPARSIDDPEDFVRIEVEAALRRNIPLIPVLVRGLTMPPADFFPSSLKDLAFRQGMALRSDPDFHRDVSRLLTSIVTHLETQRESRPP
jgi:hypothetical protein